MKESIYNIRFSHEGKQYVFNALTGAFAATNEEFSKILQEVENNSEWETDSDVFQNMKKAGIIISNNQDELSDYRKTFNLMQEDTSACTFTIAPSLSCNFRCPYCYESKNTVVLSDVYVQKLISFIKKSLEGKKSCSITWYGGEPLLCKDKIISISESIIPYCENNGIKYSSMIVTNGYLLNDDIIHMLLEHHVTNAQITLDGDREHHNAKRYLANGEGSYDRILENIRKADEAGLHVSIRINVDSNNASALNYLFEDLKQLKLKNASVYFGLITASTEACSSIAGSCLSNEQFSVNVLKWNLMLYEAGLFKSLLNVYPRRIFMPCGALQPYSILIDSHGRFYKCWDEIGLEDKSVGNLDEDESLPLPISSKISRYTEWNPFDYQECKTCKVLPLCGGYCAYLAMGNNKPVCIKWKYILVDYLKQVIDTQQ